MAQSFEFDEQVAQQLSLLFQTSALKNLRSDYFRLFSVSPGEHVLDLGCGTAANAIALVDLLKGHCKVTGVDTSEPMLAIARHNLKTYRFQDNVHLEATDGHQLPFPDEHFDSVMIIQVLEYSQDPIAMLMEASRVLKKGGKIFVADTDWDTIVWNSNQKEKTRKIVDLWSDHEADGWQGRKIPEYLQRSGFGKLHGGVFTITSSSFHEDDYSYIVTQIITAYLVKSNKMNASEIEDWIEDLKEKDRKGHFYFSLNRYAFVSMK